MDSTVKTFLDKIQELKQETVKVYIVSTSEEVDSTKLTFKQQKDLISTIADGAVGSMNFKRILNTIIIDNVGKDLTIIDRLPIILKLRVDAIGENVKIGGNTYSVLPCLDRIKDLKFNTTKTINGDFKITLKVPSLSYENQILLATNTILKKDGDSEISKNIGAIYTYEISKYIEYIEFSGETIIFSDISSNDRVKIIENLPISINREIISFMEDIKRVETELLTVTNNDGYESVIEMDISFFDS